MSASTSAPDLPLAGIIPFSATDWPGRLVATAFTQGCPLRCTYCHNPGLQPLAGGTSFAEVLTFLPTRHVLLDALVISGGEPLLHPGLGAAIAAVHALGFPVGLHTSGYAPARLRRLLDSASTRPDWVGLDVKGLPADAAALCGCSLRAASGCWESLSLLLSSGIPVQARTTIWPDSVLSHHLPLLRERVASFGCDLHVQWARGVDADGNYMGSSSLPVR